MAGKLLLPIFADFDSILAILFLLGSFVVWLVNQFNKASKEAAEAESEARPKTWTLSEATVYEEEEDEWEDAGGVDEHVREHMDTHEFDERAGGFGQLSHLDDTVDEHVHEAFDHRVGSLAESADREEAAKLTAAGPNVPTAAAAGLAMMFTDPDQLRQAIILQEVLRRPEL